MTKGIAKVLLASTFTLMAVIPVMANNTTLGFNATVTSVISIQLERVSDGVIVSGDDVTPGAFTPANDVLSFGTVSPLGMGTAAALTSSRGAAGTTGTINAFVIDTTKKLYTPSSNTALGLPKGNNNGAIYTLSGALQLRALRNSSGAPITGAGPTDIDVDNSSASTMSVIVAPSTVSFTAGSTLPASALILAPSPSFTPFTTALPNDTAFGITVGIHVPFTTIPGAKTATLTFRAT